MADVVGFPSTYKCLDGQRGLMCKWLQSLCCPINRLSWARMVLPTLSVMGGGGGACLNQATSSGTHKRPEAVTSTTHSFCKQSENLFLPIQSLYLLWILKEHEII